MNDKVVPAAPEESEEHIEKHMQHTILHITTKLAPLGLAALFSFVGSTSVDFFADLNRRVERLDHNCPIIEQRVAALEQTLTELRTVFAKYPRDYELYKAIKGQDTLLEYSGKDRVLMDRLLKDVNELQVEFKQWLVDPKRAEHGK